VFKIKYSPDEKREKPTTSRENEHRAFVLVVGRRVVHIEESVGHMAVVLVVGPIDLAVAVGKALAAVAAVHTVAVSAVGHTDFAAGLDKEIEDTEKTFGLAVVGAVGCTLIGLEDRGMMFRRDLDLEVEDKATEVMLAIQGVEVWEVRPVGWDMDWQAGLDTPGRRFGWQPQPSFPREACVAVKEVWLQAMSSRFVGQAVELFIGDQRQGEGGQKGLRMPSGRWRSR
jgi:hypothetical protein